MGLDISEVDGPVAVGEELVFTIRARNRGTAAARNVKLAISVPDQLQIMGAGPTRASRSGNLVEFPAVPSIEVGQFSDFTIRLKAGQLPAGRTELDLRLQASIESDDMRQPLMTEEAILVYQDSP